MIGYPTWVAAGIVAALLARALARPDPAVPDAARGRLTVAAIAGAILGAYLLELPADLCGWTAPGPDDRLPLGGRTVLGGMLGGWLAVEWAKRALAIAVPTGDGFALPLALALACGRMGCASAGCCAGRVVADDAAWAWLALPGIDGLPRIPVPLIEVGFHLVAAALLALAAARGALAGRRLAAYLACYGVLRLGLETLRGNPPVLLGLTWYQLLALALIALAGTTWWRRSRPATAPQGTPEGRSA